MREMKDSGIEWIGSFPKDWKFPKITYVSVSRSGGTPDRTQSQYWENGTIPWMSSGEVNKVNVYETNEKITKLGSQNSSAKILEPNNVMVALNGQGKTKGMSAILRIPAACNQSLCAFKCNEKNLYFSYLFYCFQAMYRYLRYQSGDNKRDGLAASFVKRQKIPLPSLKEQQNIADYLDDKCADIDGISKGIEEQIETLKEYKKSVITQAVTKGLDPDVEMKDSGIPWCPRIPKHWTPINPKVLFSLRNERAVSGQRQLTASQKYGIIYQDEFMKKESQKVVTVVKDFSILKQVRPNDFVISMRSFQGGLEYSTLSGSISSAYVMLVPNLKRVFPPFYRYFFKSSKYINALQSTSNLVRDGQAMRYSNFTQVYLFDIPMKEQEEISNYLDRKIPQIDTIITKKQEQLDTLKEYKKSLIYEYVTGKKEVPTSWQKKI